MKAAVQFKAEERKTTGTGGARAVRNEGSVPINLYGKDFAPVNLSVNSKELELAYRKGGFFNHLVSLTVGGKEYFALPKDIQQHPVTDRIEHADFLKVDEKSKITVQIPVKFKNMERSIGIKRGGVLNVVRHEVGVICSPDNIPSSIDIDLLEININQSIHISAIKLPEGVTPEITSRDFTIATIAGRSSKMDDLEDKPAAAEGDAAAAAAPGAAAAAGAAPAAGAAAAKKPEAKK